MCIPKVTEFTKNVFFQVWAGGQVRAGAGLGHQQEGQGDYPEEEDQPHAVLKVAHGIRLGQGGGGEDEQRGGSGLAGDDGCKETHVHWSCAGGLDWLAVGA